MTSATKVPGTPCTAAGNMAWVRARIALEGLSLEPVHLDRAGALSWLVTHGWTAQDAIDAVALTEKRIRLIHGTGWRLMGTRRRNRFELIALWVKP